MTTYVHITVHIADIKVGVIRLVLDIPSPGGGVELLTLKDDSEWIKHRPYRIRLKDRDFLHSGNTWVVFSKLLEILDVTKTTSHGGS